MKGILLLNGEPYAGTIAKDGLVFCCDGGYDWAKDKIAIDENVGDFDSLSYEPEPKPLEIYPSEKNFTDGEIALFKLIERGAEEIEIYGGGGKREDHFLGNLHLLYAAFLKGVKATLVNNDCTITIATGRVSLMGKKGKTISLLPFGGNALVSHSWGLKYPLEGLPLPYGACRGISNVALSDDAGVFVERGVLLVIVNKGE